MKSLSKERCTVYNLENQGAGLQSSSIEDLELGKSEEKSQANKSTPRLSSW
jgi:hypothetical protein